MSCIHWYLNFIMLNNLSVIPLDSFFSIVLYDFNLSLNINIHCMIRLMSFFEDVRFINTGYFFKVL